MIAATATGLETTRCRRRHFLRQSAGFESATAGRGCCFAASAAWMRTVFDNTLQGFRKTTQGSENTARGFSATARGSENTARGFRATARGSENTARGFSVTARGSENTARGLRATARGSENTARGLRATARGSGNTARGFSVTARGSENTARGFRKNRRGFQRFLRSRLDSFQVWCGFCQDGGKFPLEYSRAIHDSSPLAAISRSISSRCVRA